MSAYQTSRITTNIRTWLDANNKARESKDQVDVARAGQAMKTVGEDLAFCKRGQMKVHQEAMPLLLLVDSLFAVSTQVQPLFAADRPTAHDLVRFLRGLEDTVRRELGSYTCEAVPARSTAHDEEEDKAFSAPAPPRPVSSAPKLILS